MQQRRALHTHHHDPTADALCSRHPFATLAIGALPPACSGSDNARGDTMMLSTAMIRAVASLCGLLSALSAAVGATILFAWALDSSRPVRVAPLLAGAGLLLLATLLFIVRRALRIGSTSRDGGMITQRPT